MTSNSSQVRQRLGGVALVLAPIALLAGALVHPQEVTDAGRQLQITSGALNRWYVAHLLYFVATALFVPAVLALGRRLRERAPGLELWGSGLAVVGLFSTAGLVAVEGFGGWQLAQLANRDAATQAYDNLTHSAGIVVPFAIVGLTLSIGLVVLAVGLLRTSSTAPWTAWTLGAGAVVLAVGLAGELHGAFLAGIGGLAVALVAVGLDDIGVHASAPTLATRSRPFVTNS